MGKKGGDGVEGSIGGTSATHGQVTVDRVKSVQKQFQQRLNELRNMNNDPPELLHRLDSMTLYELSELLPALSLTGDMAYQDQALRDTVQAVIHRKLTESLIESITKLDSSTERLAKVGWWLTIVVGVAGILVSLVITFR